MFSTQCDHAIIDVALSQSSGNVKPGIVLATFGMSANVSVMKRRDFRPYLRRISFGSMAELRAFKAGQVLSQQPM
jgi:hypothetical protein